MKRIVLKVVAMVLALVLVGLVGFILGERSKAWHAAVAAHHADVRRCLKLGEEVNKRVNLAWRNHISLDGFTDEFGKAEPIELLKYPDAGDRTTHVWVHADSYRVFYLEFVDNVLTGYDSGFGVDDIQPHLPSITSRIKQLF